MSRPLARKGVSKVDDERAVRRGIDIIELDDCQLLVSETASPPGKPSSSDRGSEIANDLAGAMSPDERKQLIHVALRTIGFDWLCYCRLTRLGELVNRVQYFHPCSPPGWAQRYVDQRYFELDPRMAFACRHDWPLVWDHTTLAHDGGADERNERMQHFLDDIQASGMHSGIAFGLVDPGSREHSVMIFSSANPTRGWINDHTIGQAYAVGLGIHAFLAGKVWEAEREPELSDVQRRILKFTASGMSDREISTQLNMSISNVDYHMRQIRKKYGVLNRVQLAYLAGRLLVA